MSGFFGTILSVFVLLFTFILYITPLASLVCIFLGVYCMYKAAKHYKTIRRPWLLIVIGAATPFVVYIIYQILIWSAH